MNTKKIIERFVNYVLLTGFLLLGTGILISIVMSGLPVELTLIIVGIVLLILGVLMAKIFGDMLGWKT
jgi:hypothetical protein